MLCSSRESYLQANCKGARWCQRGSREEPGEVNHIKAIGEIAHVDLQPHVPLSAAQYRACRRIDRPGWPHAFVFQIDLRDDAFTVLLDGFVEVPFGFDRKAAVVRAGKC